MKEYEILVETINPCGGEAHAKKEILEAECESPESYVQANAPTRSWTGCRPKPAIC